MPIDYWKEKKWTSEEGQIPNFSLIYDLNIVQDKLFVFSNGPSEVYIYDLIEEEWLDNLITGVRGTVGVSNEFNGKVYYAHKELLGDSGQYHYALYSYDLKTAKISKETEAFPLNLRNTKHYRINGEDRLYTMNNAGKLVYFYEKDDDLKVHTMMETITMGQAGQIQSLHYDDETDTLFASGYMGSQGYQRSMETGQHFRFKLGQVENMDSENGQIYFGEYPSARIVSKSIGNEKDVEQVFSLSDENQDRPYMVLAQDKMLYIGTIGKSAETTGRLAVYDTEKATAKGENPKVYTILEDHSVVGIAVKDKMLYGSTTIFGGLGADPIAKQAQVFKFNLETGKVEKHRELSELNENIKMISGLHFDEQGRLFGFANGTIFELDQQTLEVKRHKRLHKGVNAFGKWRPVEAHYHDGVMYANPGFILTAIDPETFKHVEIREKVDKFSVDKRGDILYASEVKLHRMKVDIVEKDISHLKEELIPIAIKNASFEEKDEEDRPLYWEPYFSKEYPDTDYSVSDEQSTEGKQSLKIFDRNGSASMFVTSEKIPVSEGETYIAYSDVYLDNGRARMFIRFYNEEGKQVAPDTKESLTYLEGKDNHGMWKKLEVSGVVPKGAHYLRVTVGTNNADQTEHAYFDNVRLFRKEQKVKLNVPNASFEEYEIVDGQRKPKHWTSLTKEDEKTDKVYFKQSSNQAFDGEHSLFVYDKSTQHTMYVQSAKIAVNPFEKHELKVQMYFGPQALSTRASQVMVRYYDDEDQQVSKDVLGETFVNQGAGGMTGKWIEKVLNTEAPENASYLRIILGANKKQATDGVYYDQVELYRYGTHNDIDDDIVEGEDTEKPKIPEQEVALRDQLMNPSFEELDEYGRIKYWTSLLNHEAISENVYYHSSDKMATDGERSIFLYDKDNNHSMFVTSDPFKVEEGDWHETKVSVYLLEENISDRLTNLLVRYYNEKDQQIGPDYKATLKASDKKGEWVTLSTLSQVPKGADRMRIILGTANQGQNHVGAYYDDVRLTTLCSVKEFNELYEKAKEKDLSAYQLESVAAYESVLEKYAKEVQENSTGKDFVEKDLCVGFMNAIQEAEKDFKKVDRSKLEIILSQYEHLDFDKIEEELVEKLDALVQTAAEMLENQERSQEAIDQLFESFEEALDSLVEINFSKLVEVMEEADKIDRDVYGEASLKHLDSILSEAKLLLSNPNLQQEDIDEMVKKVEEAMEHLVLKDNNDKDKEDDKEEKPSQDDDSHDEENKHGDKDIDSESDDLVDSNANESLSSEEQKEDEHSVEEIDDDESEDPIDTLHPDNMEDTLNQDRKENSDSVPSKELVATGHFPVNYLLGFVIASLGFVLKNLKKD